MKKTLSFLMALVLVLSLGTMAFADGTTTLSTTVPPATYTLNIPADQEIAFGATSTNIGSVSVTDGAGFAAGKNLKVTISYGTFTSETASGQIPFSLRFTSSESNPYVTGSPEVTVVSGDSITFEGLTSGKTQEYFRAEKSSFAYNMNMLYVDIKSADWGKALGGDYTATITFTSEVVLAE